MSERRSVASEIRRGDHLEMWDWSLEIAGAIAVAVSP
jgi:hypothetical protein